MSAGTFQSERIMLDLLNSLGKAGWPEVDDINTMDTVNRSMRALRYVSPEGVRQDTASRYLHPRLHDGWHPHLHVVVESQVERVLFDDNKKAVGVVYRPNPTFRPDSEPRMIKARRMVVLSCGSLGNPLVLERSGIGSPGIVKRSGVDLVADLPGVGENYDDHHLMLYAYKSSLNPNETLDSLASGRSDPQEMMMQKDRILGWNGIDVQVKARPSEAEVLSLGPEFQEAWDKEFKAQPNKPLMLMSATVW